MAFGKRKAPPAGAAAAPSLSTPSLGAPRAAAPEHLEIFNGEPPEGESGGMLQRLAARPAGDAPPDARTVKERLDADRAKLAARNEEMNRRAREKFAAAQVRPFLLIPEPCWNSRTGALLTIRLGLSPYDDWNVAFLAADQATAAVLDVPPHPNGYVPAFVAAAEKFMVDADAQLNAAQLGAERSREFESFEELREEICDKVRALANRFLASMDEDWQKSKALPAT